MTKPQPDPSDNGHKPAEGQAQPEVVGQFTIDPVAVFNVLTQRAHTDKELALHLEAARWQVASVQEQQRRLELEKKLLEVEAAE